MTGNSGSDIAGWHHHPDATAALLDATNAPFDATNALLDTTSVLHVTGDPSSLPTHWAVFCVICAVFHTVLHAVRVLLAALPACFTLCSACESHVHLSCEHHFLFRVSHVSQRISHGRCTACFTRCCEMCCETYYTVCFTL